MNEIMSRAAAFVWASGRVLEQRRFEVLFGGAADGSGLAAAVAAYRTAATRTASNRTCGAPRRSR